MVCDVLVLIGFSIAFVIGLWRGWCGWLLAVLLVWFVLGVCSLRLPFRFVGVVDCGLVTCCRLWGLLLCFVFVGCICVACLFAGFGSRFCL